MDNPAVWNAALLRMQEQIAAEIQQAMNDAIARYLAKNRKEEEPAHA